VVFADAEEVQAQPVGQHSLGDDIPQHLRLGQPPPGAVEGDIAEGVKA
jgi:hypothetical protein